MDLEIQDVAELLNTSEGTISDWLADGKIPAYKIKDEYRFSRLEIEDWVINHNLVNKDAEGQRSAGGNQQYCLYRAVHIGGVLNAVPGKTKEEVISNATELLAAPLKFDAAIMKDLLLDRERLMPTALNNGIGIPHTREVLLNTHQDIVAIVFPDEPIEYGALDGKPVHCLFFLFASEDKRHLQLLAKIAHLSNQIEARKFLHSQPNKKELLHYIKEWEAKIPSPEA
jgi:PTS system nitrogen regulatory IIA component